MRGRVLLLLVPGILAQACDEPASPPASPNHAPVIDSLITSPAQVAPGRLVQVQVRAHDEDGDALTYVYQPDAGSVQGTGATVAWLTPSSPGNYGISVVVRDGRGAEASDRSGITVVPPTLMVGEIFAVDGENTLWGTMILIYRSLADYEQWRPAQPPTIVESASHFGAPFVVDVIEPGTYWVDAWQDSNHDGCLDAGDRYGAYGFFNGSVHPIEIRESLTTDIGQIQLYLNHAPCPGGKPLEAIPGAVSVHR